MTTINQLLYMLIAYILSFYVLVVPVQAHEDIELQIESLNQELSVDTNNGEHYLKRAELHRIHQDWRAALEDYDRAEQFGVASDILNFYKGRMYFEAGEEESALALLNKAIAAMPSHVPSLVERSKLSIHPKYSAVSDLDRAIQLSSNPSPDLFLNRANLIIANDANDIEKMISGLEQGVARLGPLVSLIEFGVNQSEVFGRWETAQKLIEDLPAILRQSPKWLFKEGQIQEKLTNKDVAQQLYKNALQKIKELPPSRANSAANIELKSLIIAEQENFD